MRKILILVAALSLTAICANAELFVVKMTLQVRTVDPTSGNLSNATLTAANIVASCGEDPANATLVLDSDDPGAIFVVSNDTGDTTGCDFTDDTSLDRTCSINADGNKFYCQAFFTLTLGGGSNGFASAVGPIDKRIDSATGAVVRYNWNAKIQGVLDGGVFGVSGSSVGQPNLPFYGTFSSAKRFVLTGSSNCTAPSATTSAASNVSTNTATLNGTANPNGFKTSVHFDYGLLPGSLGQSTPAQSIGTGTANVAITADIGPLIAGTTNFFQAVATSGCGTAKGDIMFFITSGP